MRNLFRLSSLVSVLFFVNPILVLAQNTTNTSEPRVVSVPPESVKGIVLTDKFHFLCGENALATSLFLSQHRYQSGSTQFGDNYLFPDCMYDGVHRRFLTRSLQLVDIGDPVDIRLGRAPGTYPNGLDRNGRLKRFEIVGTIGSSGYRPGGLTSYEVGIEFGTNGSENGREYFGGYLCLSGAVEFVGVRRSDGQTTPAGDLACHLYMRGDGSFVFGHNTDVRQRTEIPYVFHGDVEIDGDLVINGNIIVHGTIRAEKFEPIGQAK